MHPTARDRSLPACRRCALVLLMLALAGCGADRGGGQPATTVAPAPTAPTTATASATAAAPMTTTAASAASAAPSTTTPRSGPSAVAVATATTSAAAPAGPVDFRVETVASGLEAPWALAFAPDGRIFLTERPGRVRVIGGGQLRPEPVATIADVLAQGEGGLLGLALDPDFARTRALYLYHTHRDGQNIRNRVVRYIEDGNGLREPRVIIDGIPGGRIHNGGRIAFGPDGKLYIGTGEAGQPDLARDRNSLGGKILRLNADGAIPDDNPFPGSPVYSYGHRNVQGLAWQPGTGQLYATEHGPSAHDEVNRIEPGANYGWPATRGDAGPAGESVRPVIESGDTTTWAPSGATFVGAATFPQWRGSLLFAGLRSTTLWRLALSPTGGQPTLEPLLAGEYGRLRAVVEGPDGLLYVLTNSRDGRGRPGEGDDRLLRLAPG